MFNDDCDRNWYKLMTKISQIGERHKIEVPKLCIENDLVFIECENIGSDIGQEFWKLWREFPEMRIKLRVEGKDYLYSPEENKPLIMINEQQQQLQQSQWVSENPTIAHLLQNQGTYSVHSLDRDRGFTCLNISPFRGLSDALFSPNLNDFVGKPADFTTRRLIELAKEENKSSPEVIGGAKDKAIRDALASSEGWASVDYEFLWRGDLWEMRYTATKLSSNEILLFGENVKSRQREYWLDMAARR
ncbi:MAG: hypothetical protein J7647_30915 [Cyanobacteria bacterium SBLK]|nr:hypothetical protein [Cyanobacteria bacterium SBLK]